MEAPGKGNSSIRKEMKIIRHRFFNPLEGKEQFIIELASKADGKTVRWYKRP
ncbi:hypothetical protein H8E06_01355 [bacterium]|nr:hypothetical protein [bacterium]